MSFVSVAIGAGLGVLKSELVDRPRERRQRTLAAETQRYSPWTKLQAQPIQEADALGDVLSYGTTAAQMSQNTKNAQLQQDLLKSQSDLMKAQGKWLQAGGSPQYTAAQTATSATPWSGWGQYGPRQYSPNFNTYV